MANGRLANLKDSSYVRTDPVLATRIGRNLLAFSSQEPTTVLDPSSGTGTLFSACAHIPTAQFFGVEISADRAAESRQMWPQATIVTSAFEAVTIHGTFNLALLNPPYFQQNGKRASLRFVVDVGEHQRPGDIMVAILTARADWDAYLVTSWLTWYDEIRIWKFPDRSADDQEGAFDDYAQIVVIGVRRATQREFSAIEKQRLLAYQWRDPEKYGASGGWRGGTAPPDLPEVPIDDPYRVPSSREIPRLVVRNANEAALLYALKEAGGHLTPAWQGATTWPEEGQHGGSLAMPFTGEAHVAAEIMNGCMDGDIVYGPTTDHPQAYLFTAFIGRERVKRPIEAEVRQKLYEQGCIRVELEEESDKPILGVLALETGITHYHQGEQVFAVLRPWLQTFATLVSQRRTPLYQLDPADWELPIVAQFGQDKQLPRAASPGLAVPQQHRVYAMGRALDAQNRAAIQGQPGTGKTRLAGATAARQAYRWRHRCTEFAHSAQPRWVRTLRRSWVKNPRTLALLGLEPVSGWRFDQARRRAADIQATSPHPSVVAYREIATGRLIAPEHVGPRALPVLVTTPLKVTKEYGIEIRAAFPEAEVMAITSFRDIDAWLARCATSSAPVIFGIVSHSKKDATGRKWRPAILEKTQVTEVPDLEPGDHLATLLEPIHDQRTQRIVGYRVKATGKLLTREVAVSHFSCPTCKRCIEGTPGHLHQSETQHEQQVPPELAGTVQQQAPTRTEPVTSRTWFTIKQRWCMCTSSRRNQDRLAKGKPPVSAPLFQDERVATTTRRYPACTFAEWSATWATMRQHAQYQAAQASTGELVEHVRRDASLLRHLIEGVLRTPQALDAVAHIVERVDPAVGPLHACLARETAQLSALLLEAALDDDTWVEHLIRQASTAAETLPRLLALARSGDAALTTQITACEDTVQRLRADHLLLIAQALREQPTLQATACAAVVGHPQSAAQMRAELCALWPHLESALTTLWQRGDVQARARVLLHGVQHQEQLLSALIVVALEHPQIQATLIAHAHNDLGDLIALRDEADQVQAEMVDLVVAAILQQPVARRQALHLLIGKEQAFGAHLAEIARHDRRALLAMLPSVGDREHEIWSLADSLDQVSHHLATLLEQAARRDGSSLVLTRLVEATQPWVAWQARWFKEAYETAHRHSQAAEARGKKKRRGSATDLFDTVPRTHARARSRLTAASEGPIGVEEPDMSVVADYTPITDISGRVSAYSLSGSEGRHLVPLYSPHSGRVVGYVDVATGSEVRTRTSYDFRTPPPDSFSPPDYLYRFYPGCVTLAIVDESHNGRKRDTDISQAFRQVMRAAQARMLTSGTHYGGDILGFFHYWYGYNPSFWKKRGYGWNDAEKALTHYGVVQHWTKEFESDARKGTGQTTISVSTVPAPGLSAKLIPGLLEDLTYLTILDVGAHMPPMKEIPHGLLMRDPVLESARQDAKNAYEQASEAYRQGRERERALHTQPPGEERAVQLAVLEGELLLAKDTLQAAQDRRKEVEIWVKERDLAGAYGEIVRQLEEKARVGNTAARLTLGTIPRLFAALPCQTPFEVYKTNRGDWGDKQTPQLVIRTPVLAWDYVYPMERWLVKTVTAELAESRTVMIYIEQTGKRSMATRLTWVFEQAGMTAWTLPENVEAEDRQQVILEALNEGGHQVVLVPYRLVNEGVNLQQTRDRTGVQTIIWYEQAMNLFMYLQASQRAWRLGAEKEVRISLPYYLGTAAHSKMRRLGGQSGAAAAFAGEPARGELIRAMGADKTTLARLSASLEDESLFDEGEQEENPVAAGGVVDDRAQIEAAFARRNDELVAALREGRQFLGVKDTLLERLTALRAFALPSVWATQPSVPALSTQSILLPGAVPPEEAPGVIEAPSVALWPVDGVPAATPPTVVPTPVAPRATVDKAPIIPTPAGPSVEPVVPLPPSPPLPRPVLAPVAELIFGDEEHIRRVRRTRGTQQKRRSLPRLKNPVVVKEIPVVVLPPPVAARPTHAVEFSSIFDLSFA